jgi:hypothetical protein
MCIRSEICVLEDNVNIELSVRKEKAILKHVTMPTIQVHIILYYKSFETHTSMAVKSGLLW